MTQLVGYDKLRARLRAIKPGPAMMRALGVAVVGEAKLRVPRKTATLARSIHVGPVTNTSVVVKADAKYAAYVELGTRAHEITPKAKKALRWATSSSKGFRLSGAPSSAKGNNIGWAFAKRVHHPGTRAQPYLVPGAKAAVDNIGTDIITGAWNGAS